MLKFKVYRIWMLLVLMGLMGCSKDEPNTPASAASKKRTYEGSLQKLFLSFYENPEKNNLSEKCDLQLKDIKLKLAKDLDDRQADIQEFADNQMTHSEDPINKIETEKIGDLTVKKNPKKPSKNEWVLDAGYSWFELIDIYNKIKDTKVDASWVQLNSEIRAIVPDDQDRILDFRNFDILHSDETFLRKLLRELESVFRMLFALCQS